MSGTLDLSGGTCTIKIRKGGDQDIDFRCTHTDGSGFDLTGQTPSARVIEGETTHPLTSTVVGSSIIVNLPHALSSTLPLYAKIAVSITAGATGAVTPLVYGQLVTVQDPTA